MGPAEAAARVARLDALVVTHKREERKHRKAAQAAAIERDRLIQWCREHSIAVVAQPERHGQ